MLIKNKKWILTTLLFVSFILCFKAYSLDMQSHLLYGSFAALLSMFFVICKLNQKIEFSITDLFFGIFYIFFLASIKFSQHPYGFHEFICFGLGFLIYFFLSQIKLDSLKLKYSLILLIFLTTFFTIFGITDFVFSPENRLAGLFQGDFSYSSYPNAMSDLLLISLPILWLIYIEAKQSKLWQYVCYLLAILYVAALFLTFSRGALLSLVCVLATAALVHIYLKRNFKNTLKSGLHIAGILLVGFLLATSLNSANKYQYQVADRFANQDISSQQSTSERTDFFNGAIQITKNNPWFGYGPGGFLFAYPQHQTELLAVSDHPHNLILKISSESGIVAATAFLLFLLSLFFRSFHILKNAQHKSYLIAVMLSIFGVFAHNLIDYNLNFTLLSALFFSGLGLLANQEFWGKKTSSLPSLLIIKEKTYRAAFCIFALIIFCTTIFQAYGFWHLKKASTEPPSQTLQEFQSHLSKAFISPFKMNAYEVLAAHNQSNQSDYLQSKLSFAAKKYTNYHPLQYFAIISNQSPLSPKDLLNLDGSNNLQYHLLYLESLDHSDLAKQSSNYLNLMQDYTNRLAVNMHLTLTTQNPNYADQIYNFYIQFWNDRNLDMRETWVASYQNFRNIWLNEITKFNQRYNTNLNLRTDHATINSHN